MTHTRIMSTFNVNHYVHVCTVCAYPSNDIQCTWVILSIYVNISIYIYIIYIYQCNSIYNSKIDPRAPSTRSMEMLWRSERTKYYALKSLKQNAKVRAMKGKLRQFLQFLDFYGFLWISWSLAPLSVSSCVWVSRTGFPALSFRVSSLESVKSHWVAAKPILPKSLEGGQTI